MRTLTFSALLCLSICLSWAASIPEEGNTEAAAEATVAVNMIVNPEETTSVLDAEETTEDEQLQEESRFNLCPPGWFRSGSRCYLYVSSSMTWINAEKYCVNLQGALASVQNSQEYHFLQSLAQVAGRSSVWIGGFYFQGSWMWIDRAGFYYTNWSTQNSVSNACIHLRSTSGWSNSNCGSSLPFFCAMDPNSC